MRRSRSGQDGFGRCYPDTIFWSVKWIWETSLSAFLLSLLFMLTVEMEGDERLVVVDRLRPALGRRGADQSLRAVVPALRRMLAGLPTAPSRKTVRRAGPAERGRLLDDDHAVAGAQLRGVRQARVRARQLRQRAAHRQQSSGRGHVRAGLPSQPTTLSMYEKYKRMGEPAFCCRAGTAGAGSGSRSIPASSR